MVLDDLKRMGVQSVSNIGPSISYVDHDSEIYKVLTSAGITSTTRSTCSSSPRTRWTWSRSGSPSPRRTRFASARKHSPRVLLPCRHHEGRPVGLRQRHRPRGRRRPTPKPSWPSSARSPGDPLRLSRRRDGNGEDAQYMLDHTSADGFWTGSSTERLPIEQRSPPQRRVRGAAILEKSRQRLNTQLTTGEHHDHSRNSGHDGHQGGRGPMPRRRHRHLGRHALHHRHRRRGDADQHVDVTNETVAERGGTPLATCASTRRARLRPR